MGQPRRAERGLNPGSCPVTSAMAVIAPKWAAEVWKQLAVGDAAGRGSEELRRAVPGVSRKMLTEQLREFEAAGVVRREVDERVPPRVTYSLTVHGRALGAVWFFRGQKNHNAHVMLSEALMLGEVDPLLLSEAASEVTRLAAKGHVPA